jgi:hypothetical protein
MFFVKGLYDPPAGNKMQPGSSADFFCSRNNNAAQRSGAAEMYPAAGACIYIPDSYNAYPAREVGQPPKVVRAHVRCVYPDTGNFHPGGDNGIGRGFGAPEVFVRNIFGSRFYGRCFLSKVDGKGIRVKDFFQAGRQDMLPCMLLRKISPAGRVNPAGNGFAGSRPGAGKKGLPFFPVHKMQDNAAFFHDTGKRRSRDDSSVAGLTSASGEKTFCIQNKGRLSFPGPHLPDNRSKLQRRRIFVPKGSFVRSASGQFLLKISFHTFASCISNPKYHKNILQSAKSSKL